MATPTAKFPNAQAYWENVGPRLSAFIDQHRDRKMEECIVHALAMYSYVQEHLTIEATSNIEVLKRVGILLVLAQDALRGLVGAQRDLSPVAIACLARNVFETRCNLLYIYKSGDPLKWADRFQRYIGVEKVLHDDARPSEARTLLRDGELEQIRSNSPEWFDNRGRVKVKHWTADKRLQSLRALATEVGLQTEYHTLYSVGSKFMHGSPMLVNLYSRGDSIGALVDPALCSRLSSLGVRMGVHLLREAVEFHGAPSFETDLRTWEVKWLAIADRLNRTGRCEST